MDLSLRTTSPQKAYVISNTSSKKNTRTLSHRFGHGSLGYMHVYMFPSYPGCPTCESWNTSELPIFIGPSIVMLTQAWNVKGNVLRFYTAQVAMKLTRVTSSLKGLSGWRTTLYSNCIHFISAFPKYNTSILRKWLHPPFTSPIRPKNAQPTSPYPLPRHSIHHSRLDLQVSSREKLSQIHPKIPKVDSWRMLVFTSWIYPPTKDASGKWRLIGYKESLLKIVILVVTGILGGGVDPFY